MLGNRAHPSRTLAAVSQRQCSMEKSSWLGARLRRAPSIKWRLTLVKAIPGASTLACRRHATGWAVRSWLEGQGWGVLEKRDWDRLSERVIEASYSVSRSFRTAAI